MFYWEFLTSGNSANILEAVKAAKAKGMQVILLTGKDGGALANSGAIEIRVDHFGFAVSNSRDSY
jgi:D-sedoheptulose 7-phosphate isomerase